MSHESMTDINPSAFNPRGRPPVSAELRPLISTDIWKWFTEKINDSHVKSIPKSPARKDDFERHIEGIHRRMLLLPHFGISPCLLRK